MAISAANWLREYRLQNRGFQLQILFPFAAMLLAAGCNNSAGSAPAALDACSLIDATKASSIIGAQVMPKPVNNSASGGGGASICNFGTGKTNGGFMLLAGSIDMKKGASAEAEDQKAQIIADTKKNLGITPTIESIQDLGDAAYVVNMAGSVQLHVLSGNESLVISRTVPASAQIVDELKSLAKLALANSK